MLSQLAMADTIAKSAKRSRDEMAPARKDEDDQPKVAKIDSESGRVAVEDPADRAESYRKCGTSRIPIDLLGFHPLNRGGQGLNTRHVHNIAASCIHNRFSQQRYNVVNVVKVPHSEQEKFHKQNAQKCESDEFMPRYSPSMAYALLTGHHLVHSLKLDQDGGRFLYNIQDGEKIRYKGSEIDNIRKHGVLAQEFDEKLYFDQEACLRFMSDDNLDAKVMMPQDEMTMYGTICRMMENDTEVFNKATGEYDVAKIVRKIKLEGSDDFSDDHLYSFIKFRSEIKQVTSDLFKNMQFAHIAGRARMGAHSFKTVALIHDSYSWVKVCLLMYWYHKCMKENATQRQEEYGSDAPREAGAAAVRARKMPEKPIKGMALDTSVLPEIEKFV